jgi:hypothetical protein
MCHGDKGRKVEGTTRLINPFRINGDRLSDRRDVPSRAGDIDIPRKTLWSVLPEPSGEVRSCSVKITGDITSISERQPAVYQSRLFALREGAGFYMQTEIGPRSETIFARDA